METDNRRSSRCHFLFMCLASPPSDLYSDFPTRKEEFFFYHRRFRTPSSMRLKEHRLITIEGPWSVYSEAITSHYETTETIIWHDCLSSVWMCDCLGTIAVIATAPLYFSSFSNIHLILQNQATQQSPKIHLFNAKPSLIHSSHFFQRKP